MPFDFTGAVVCVTGGGRGVGRTLAQRFAAAGAHVVVNYFRDRAAAEDTLAAITERGGSAEAVRASVARREGVDRLFDRVEAAHGRLDVLVCNAASGAFRPLAELSEKDWARAVDTNLRGALWCARRAAPLMPSGGAIVTLSSSGASRPLRDYAAIGVSKAAVEALTRYLALEYGPRGIRVNAASAGPLESDAIRMFPRAEELAEAAVASTPLGRLGTAADLADLVLFLASPSAGWITGQTVLADGGLSVGAGALGALAGGRFEVG
ncbi:NAD(P)-dependent dehydrogenase (short-subunit alcohol dehydrogenase family) [Allonocardiopsis opalescens]|uniref:NAD(P)-dependent dehydrogenase (Short-subunit alcohol dehydrogenase family) n=1 Tax=Allonocardiopsis opalescens TaxID=1144618 RepID=A0A2T0QCN0_9ACTN|nr:NAD(P)-dependent dehydrogenase (short-subunit alcohol dehydrogenase family) [Allonocardiopsis opalescens]